VDEVPLDFADWAGGPPVRSASEARGDLAAELEAAFAEVDRAARSRQVSDLLADAQSSPKRAQPAGSDTVTFQRAAQVLTLLNDLGRRLSAIEARFVTLERAVTGSEVAGTINRPASSSTQRGPRSSAEPPAGDLLVDAAVAPRRAGAVGDAKSFGERIVKPGKYRFTGNVVRTGKLVPTGKIPVMKMVWNEDAGAFEIHQKLRGSTDRLEGDES
jgi:hypothetical protein